MSGPINDAATDPIEWARSLAKPAIALFRPYPPYQTQKIRSRLGGNPELPGEIEWPFGPKVYSNGSPVALHFLAQIDLTEMPYRHELLPSTGTLLFFAYFGDLTWSGEKDYVRVIYDPESDGMLREPPAAISPLQDGYHEFDKNFALETEPKRISLNAWPLIAAAVQSLPGFSAVSHKFTPREMDYYKGQVRNFLCSTIAKKHQIEMLPRMTLADLGWLIKKPNKKTEITELCYSEAFAVKRFTELWNRHIFNQIDGLIRSIKYSISSALEAGKSWELVKATEPDKAAMASREIENAATTAAQLQELLQDAESAKQKAPAIVRDIVKVTNDSWQNSTAHVAAQDFIRWFNLRLNEHPEHSIQQAMAQIIRECGEDIQLFQTIPQGWFHVMQDQHLVGRGRRVSIAPPEIHFHQMFGHIKTSQWDSKIDCQDICLLQLHSDYGSNLMICDVGEMEFWIKPEDLAKLDFSKVWGTTQGG